MKEKFDLPPGVKAAQDRANAAKQKDAMAALLASEGWRILREIIEAQVQARIENVVYLPLGPDRSVELQEYEKGEIGGLRLALNLPEGIHEGASAILQQLQSSEDESDDESYPGDGSDTGFDPDYDERNLDE